MPLHAWLLSRRVQPARGRTAPAVLDLCLHVPPHVGALELSVRFSKGFLTVGEYPPDAHRGFDIPAAVVSYGEPRGLRRVQWAMRTGEAAQEQQTGQAGQAGQAGQGQEQLLATPLLGSLPPSAFQQVGGDRLLAMYTGTIGFSLVGLPWHGTPLDCAAWAPSKAGELA